MTTSQQNKLPCGIASPGSRLFSIAELVRKRLPDEKINEELFAIDVGTDHAKLPVFLIQSGFCAHVTATDVRDGPIAVARKNVAERTIKGESLLPYIDIVKADGLCGVDTSLCNRIIIAGMGGELISEIIKHAAFLFAPERRIKLILQPQTRQAILRDFLAESGFSFIEETTVEDAGKLYPVFSVVFTGKSEKLSRLEAYFGKDFCERKDSLFIRYFMKKYAKLESIMINMPAERELSKEKLELYCEMKKILPQISRLGDYNDNNK